jgi:ABC-type multidrug transport system permease subunit
MRWLLVKDLQVLRRSPVLVGVLVIYPVAVALLIGLALSGGPTRPRVAIVNEIPPGQGRVQIGNQHFDVSGYQQALEKEINAVKVPTREEAIAKVRSGNVLAAIVIPADFAAGLSSGTEQSRVEVIYNGDALKQSYVQSTIDSELSKANLDVSGKVEQLAASYVDLLLRGGSISNVDILGLERARGLLAAALRGPLSPQARAALAPVATFAGLAVDNFAVSKQLITTVGQPISVRRTLISGRKTPLDTYAVAIAVSVSLMFVCVLLAAGALALEREENAYGRLVRGLVRRETLLGEKIVLAAGCSALVAGLMLAGISIFVPLDWGRVGGWVAGLLMGAVAFAAMGVAIGVLAREVRAASLLAFLLVLPLAFLALVPSGAVSQGLYDVIRVISAVFPFKATLQAMDAAINGASPGLGVSVLHLAAVAALFAGLARLGMRRLAS